MDKKNGSRLSDDGVLYNVKYVVRNTWKFERIIILYILIQTVIGVLTPLFGIYLPSVILQGVTKTISLQAMLLTVGALALGMAAFNFTATFLNSVIGTNLMNNKIHYLIEMFKKRMEADYQNIESPEGQNKFEKGMGVLFNDSSGPSGMLTTFGGLLASTIGFFVYSGIISKLSPVIVIILISTSLLHFFVLKNISAYEQENRDRWVPLDRKIGYVLNKISDYGYAKDIRMYSMGKWLTDILDSVISARVRWHSKVAGRRYLAAVSDAAVLTIRDGMAYIYIIGSVLSGRIQVPQFVLYFGAITGFSAFISNIVQGLAAVYRTSNDISAIRDFLEMPDGTAGTKTLDGTNLCGESISIEFKNVFFRYADDGPLILDDLSFTIRKGEKIALVGSNGAGKTTLIKLLCGFYRPSGGGIFINGVPLSELDWKSIYRLYCAVFQDIFVLPMTVAQNVALLGDEMTDRDRVAHCLEQAGLDERITDIDTPLTKMLHPRGIELSGGETQKLLLARALYKDAPAVILDEPTAALDPIAESRLYERYAAMIGRRTSIFISHRLASTRFCDRIFYLDKGRITESGTHDELMRLRGKYCGIYNMQSHYYAQGGGNCG